MPPNTTEIIPTKSFYQTFRLYAPSSKCKACGQEIKSKRPEVKFYLQGITKNGMWRVKFSNRKTVVTFHPKFFKELPQEL